MSDELDQFEFIINENYYGNIPEPEPATHHIPYWYKQLPNEVTGGNDRERLRQSTIRACMPFLDAMKTGWIFKTPADMEVKVVDGKWKSKNKIEREGGSPFDMRKVGDMFPEDGPLVNFRGLWRIKAPDGWSMLFTEPMNRMDESRFKAMSGIIDVDNYDNHINHPVLWTGGDWHGVIPQGTPVAQGIPFKREWFDIGATCRASTHEEEKELKSSKVANAANQRHYRDELWEKSGANTVSYEKVDDEE